VRGPIAFNIEATPPHKDRLTAAEILKRAKMLKGYDLLVTSGAPLYLDKARLFPGVAMIVGSDTLQRLLDPHWGLEVDALIEGFRQTKTEFFVVDRVIDGRLVSLADIVNPGLICHSIHGRWDVSSSDIRRESAHDESSAPTGR
jgi:hypothetical protein